MRIIVPIKQVPETNAVKMDEVTGTMIREGVEAIINPLDLYAIEAAILLNPRRLGKEIDSIRGGMNITGQTFVFKAELGLIFESTSFPKSEYANIPPSAGQARKEKRNAEP